MLYPSAFGPLRGVQSQSDRVETVLAVAARSYTRALSQQEDHEGGQFMRRLSYLATFAIFALVLVPAA